MYGQEFPELALDGRNYPTWASDVKICSALKGFLVAINPPAEGAEALASAVQYGALHFTRQHLDPDLKAEYLMEENPQN